MMETQRPQIEIEPTPIDRVVDTLAMIGLLYMVAITVIYYPQLPATIPTHFDLAGKVDGWGSKLTLSFLPVISAVFYFALSTITRFPHIYNYPVPITAENVEKQYRIGISIMRWLKMEFVCIFAFLTQQIIAAAQVKHLSMQPWVPMLFVAAILITSAVHIVLAYRAK
ncbi:MAG: DUF1648 domain-containing protein [Armatimonadetes bacterium]|nr:DUF1648 domain-containing protein [Armatimonadota bacterium]